jgi:acyl-CoA synthetase (AMP-forming)/AMP-acid ligase II
MLDWLFDRMLESAARPAIAEGDNVCDYAALLDRVSEWDARLALADLRGRVVSLEAEYGIEAVAAFLAATNAGNVIVPISRASRAHADDFLSVAQVEYRICPEQRDQVIVATGRRASHDMYAALRRTAAPGLVLFSSGSTGTHKAAVHDLGALLKKFVVRRHCYRTLVFLQLDHIGGVNTLFYTLSNGGTVVVSEGRSPRAVAEAIARHRVELLPTSPTFLNLLLLSEAHLRYDLSSLQLITYGTEPMPETTLAKTHAAFPGVRLLQTYGLSELGILRSQSRGSDSLWMRVGGEGYETKIIDGRLFIKAQSAMLGYLNAPSPFDADGFFDTGDLAEVDGEWLRIVGRKSEVINVGCNKVFPLAVENTLLGLENVEDVAIHGAPHPITGQIVVATITLRRDEDSVQFKTRMRIFCADKLAAHKIPVRVQFAGSVHSERFKKVRVLDAPSGGPAGD